MHVSSPAVGFGVGPPYPTQPAEAELARLRAQVAWLQAERAALWWAVGHDELTGLANRRLFSTLAPPILRTGRPAVVIVLDLNGFKPINDTLGHEAGDRVLQIVAGRLAACAGEDLVARLGGDEFTGVLTCPHREAPAQWWRPAVTELSAAVAEPMPVAGHVLSVTASIGVAQAQGNTLVGELLRRADLAMYHAKVNGGCFAAWGRHAVNGSDGAYGRRVPGPYREAITIAGDDPEPVDPDPASQGGCPLHAARIVDITLFPTTPETGRDLSAPTGDPFPHTLFPAAPDSGGDLSAPTCDPYRRDPAQVAPASSYRRDDPVWVYREGAWRPGIVESGSGSAVMATYRYAGGTGTVVDTMAAEYVLARAAADAQLDRGTPARAAADAQLDRGTPAHTAADAQLDRGTPAHTATDAHLDRGTPAHTDAHLGRRSPAPADAQPDRRTPAHADAQLDRGATDPAQAAWPCLTESRSHDPLSTYG